MIRMIARAIALGVSLLVVLPAGAQTGRVLRADRYTLEPVSFVRLSLGESAAPGTPALGWPADDVELVFVRSAGRQENIHSVRTDRRDPQAANIRLEQPGAYVLGFESLPREVLASDGSGGEAAGAPATPPRKLRHVDASKVIVRAGALRDHSPVVMSRAGQFAEIRLMADPTAAGPGSDVPVRLYFADGKATGTELRAVCWRSGREMKLTSDAEGVATVALDEAGIWTIEFRHAAPDRENPGGPWLSARASVTFEVPAGGGR
ncbi:MAG: hypothetical protein CHACPFDD_01964 [Phycisphaerae bacterium]|nr:hypothetical protein [Phycisphaerae bacterium]